MQPESRGVARPQIMAGKRLLAFALALAAPGAWQVASGRLRRGLLLHSAGLLLGWTSFVLLFRTFAGLLGWLALVLGYAIGAALDARRLAQAPSGTTRRARARWIAASALWLIYPAALAWLVLRASPLQLYRVPTDSMAPAIEPGDIVVVDTSAYRSRGPRRAEVAVMRAPAFAHVEFAKRVVGLPGERIGMYGTHAVIDGKPLDEPYLAQREPSPPPALAKGVPSRRIPRGHLFVLGDHRRKSADSRVYGFVPIESLTGRACYVVYPAKLARVGAAL